MLRATEKSLHVTKRLTSAFPVAPARARWQAETLRDTPRAYWPLDDLSGYPQDRSGNGLHFTSLVGEPVYRVPGPFGAGDYAIRLSGGRRIERPVVSTVRDNLTLEFFIWPEFITTTNNYISNGDSTANGWALWFGYNADFRGAAGGVAWLAYGDAQFKGNSIGYMLIHFVREAGIWKYYVNGEVDTGNAGTATPNTPSGLFTIGGGDGLQARWSHVAVYESALTAARIAAKAAIWKDIWPSA